MVPRNNYLDQNMYQVLYSTLRCTVVGSIYDGMNKTATRGSAVKIDCYIRNPALSYIRPVQGGYHLLHSPFSTRPPCALLLVGDIYDTPLCSCCCSSCCCCDYTRTPGAQRAVGIRSARQANYVRFQTTPQSALTATHAPGNVVVDFTESSVKPAQTAAQAAPLT